MRPIKSASAPRPDYPRLRAGWALLLGAAPAVASGVAWADTSVGDGRKPPDHRAPKQQQPPPQKNPAPPPPVDNNMLSGKIAAPRPPAPPPDVKPEPAPQKKPPPVPGGLARPNLDETTWLLGAGEGARVIHPHGPDEPCPPIGPATPTRRGVDLRRRT